MSNIPDESPGCYTEHGVSGYGVAAKISRSEPMTEDFVKSMAENMMLAIAGKCMELGAKCIGHIKSHLRTEAGTIKADTIGVSHGSYSSGRLAHPVRDVFIAINSIVQGIPEDAVKAATLEGMHEVAGLHGLFVVKEKEHTYFDEFDFTASKQDYIKQLAEQLDPDKNS
ncbi:MAG: hypothetical protein Q7U40_05370 [Desulfatirhabdiaceae bacterium]|nr:hypothetical protein [Desulfatirhabdiaceae bacterium]